MVGRRGGVWRLPAEPRFDLDYAYGRQGELLVGDYLAQLANGQSQIEVKRKSYVDANFYVETECDKGRTGTFHPSGLSTSEAETWAFVIADTRIVLLVPCELLRKAVAHKSAIRKEEKDGSCPTHGFLINIGLLLNLAKAEAA